MICCAVGCNHKSGSGCHFYNFPSPNDGPDWEKWYNIWVLRINKVNVDGSLWRPETPRTKLCSCHFRPEDQWDPRSRKGGLKCKEPVFFNSPASSVSLAEQDSFEDTTYTDRPAKRPWTATSQPPVNEKLKDHAFPRSTRMPQLKIREYFERQDEMTIENCETTCNSSQDLKNLNTSVSDGVLINECNMQVSKEGWQIINSEKDEPEVVELIDVSDDSAQQDESGHNSPVSQPIMHGDMNLFSHVALPASLTSDQQGAPPLKVKLERESGPESDENILAYGGDGEILSRIVCTHSVEYTDVGDECAGGIPELDRRMQSDQSNQTPKENVEVVIPRTKVPKAKVSNVKPIMVFTSKSPRLQSSTAESVGSFQSGGCDRQNLAHTNVESVYDQMFNELMTTSSNQNTSKDVSQMSVANISNILGGHQTSSENKMSLNEAVNRIKELEKALSVQRFGLQCYSGSEEKIKFYTGFKSPDTLMRFFWRIEPDDLTSERSSKWKDSLTFATEVLGESKSISETSRQVISHMDEFFLFLCHIWQGLEPEDLAERFALPSAKSAQFIILRWIYYLKAMLPCTADTTQSTSATSKLVKFQAQYKNCKLLFHRVKLRVQQKSIRNHLSSRKLHGLVGFSPAGEIVFASCMFPKGVSTVCLINNSGILGRLQSGDSVVVKSDDLGESAHLFSSYSVTIHNLPDLDSPHDPSEFASGSSSRHSSRCHTEVVRLLSAKYVNSLTGFKCFQNVVCYPFAHVVDDLWEVCCRLVNYQHGHRSL